LLLASPSADARSLTFEGYDDDFEDYVALIDGVYDWRLLKAQCFQESRLDQFAESPVGAKGLCQFMPGTWAEMTERHPEIRNVWIPEHSIMAAGRYMGRMMRFWSAERPRMDRVMLALASYNAGPGRLLQAQRAAGGAAEYGPISRRLPDVMGENAHEPLTYVENILHKWWPRLLLQ